MTLIFEGIIGGNFVLKENFLVQYENFLGTYLKPPITIT